VVSTREIVGYCSTALNSDRFHDVAVNGLQVEGKEIVNRLASAVSVSAKVIHEAAEWNADMLLVHHGLFWGDRSGPIAGPIRTRLGLLLGTDMNLVGYHLPLDAHPTLGNNALLIQELGLEMHQPFAKVADQNIGYIASSTPSISLNALARRFENLTKRSPTILPGGPDPVDRVAVVSGSGYSTLDEAAGLGCQVIITGDVREPTMATARELGVTVIAGGHEATERLGVQALADLLSKTFNVETRFFEDPNPI
jgi:dinuclear metal center YbgI/SA1388 family protein